GARACASTAAAWRGLPPITSRWSPRSGFAHSPRAAGVDTRQHVASPTSCLPISAQLPPPTSEPREAIANGTSLAQTLRHANASSRETVDTRHTCEAYAPDSNRRYAGLRERTRHEHGTCAPRCAESAPLPFEGGGLPESRSPAPVGERR